MHPVRPSPCLLVLLLLWSGLGPWQTAAQAAPSRLKVAATIFPLYDLVRHVAEPDAQAVLLLPPGASPHTFAARPSTIRAITGSAALFAIGHGLDDWVARLARSADVTRTIVVDDQIPLRTSEHAAHAHGNAAPHDAIDPHYWLAIPHAVRMVQTIATALSNLDASAAAAYQHRAAAYIQQLQAADRDIRQQLSTLPRRAIATFHSSFGYFAEAYNLQVVATFEPAPGQEPAPRYVEQFLQQIEAYNLKVLFVEPQLPQAPLTSLARDLGLTLQELDPLGGSAGRDSYIALMRFNANQIATVLQE